MMCVCLSVCNRPSLEEIRCWGDSFDRLMKSSMGRVVFREFLKCEYSEENILFWLACEDLKKDSNPEVVEEKARLIFEDYISILSPKEVPFPPCSRLYALVHHSVSCSVAFGFGSSEIDSIPDTANIHNRIAIDSLLRNQTDNQMIEPPRLFLAPLSVLVTNRICMF